MGKRTGQLAGLAALGALGYMLSKDSKGGKNEAPVETRSFSPNPAPRSMPAAERSAPMPRAMDSGDDRDVGGGFNPAGLRRNMETGEMYDPGTVTNRAPAASPRAVPRAEVKAAPVAAPASAKEDYVSQDPAIKGRASAPGEVPGAFAAVDRYMKETKGGTAPYAEGRYPMTKPQPTENTYSRTTGAEAGEAEAYKSAMDRFKKETKNMSPAMAQGRVPLTKRQPTTNTYTRKMGAQTGEAEAYRAAQAARKGPVKKMASGGMTSGASKRGDGIAQRGKTKGKMVTMKYGGKSC